MLHLSLKQIIEGNTIESQRLDYKKGWNPEDVIHTITAFATDFHNEGGGYLIIGVEEENGLPKRPISGLNSYQIDKYQKEYLNLVNRISPPYTPSLYIEHIEGKSVIVIKCYQGENRPYDCPISLSKNKNQRGNYIRKASNTVIVKSPADKARIESLRNNIPFDERRCQVADINDIDLNLIIDYLKTVSSPLKDDIKILEDKYGLLECLELTCQPKEEQGIKNAAVLMFNVNPEIYFKAAKIDVVHFRGKGTKNFTEIQFKGPLHKLIIDALEYFKNQILETLTEKSETESVSIKYLNYPYIALREIISNAVFHQGYDQRRNIEIQIFRERVEVTNYPGPLPPVTNSDLFEERVKARDYRNLKIGELLKEYGLTENRATGIPTIRYSLVKNGSPGPQFEMDDENRTYFKVTIHIHPKFLQTISSDAVITDDILDDSWQLILEFCLDHPESFDKIKAKYSNLDTHYILSELIKLEYIEDVDGKYKTTSVGREKLFSSY